MSEKDKIKRATEECIMECRLGAAMAWTKRERKVWEARLRRNQEILEELEEAA